jgi:quinol monooxygenase YgiN
MKLSKTKEQGCIRAHVTQQIPDPGASGKSNYKIVLLQEYVNEEAFNQHCNSEHVKAFVEQYLNVPDSMISECTCRLFQEPA